MHLYNHTEKLLYNCYCNFSIPVIALHKVQTVDITVNVGLGEYSSFCMGDWIYCYEVTCNAKGSDTREVVIVGWGGRGGLKLGKEWRGKG